MEILEQFSASTRPAKKAVLKDIRDFITWETNQGEISLQSQVLG